VELRLANMPPCLIGMEACVGAHHLSRAPACWRAQERSGDAHSRNFEVSKIPAAAQ
jgi:hypothetical protein